MDAESILIHAINIVILTYIDPVAIVVGIAAPHEIMPPQILIFCKVVGKESIGAENC
jgi:hypothetical protein